jgi:formylglycine-generating enzyme required for sulfatase activity
LRLFEYACAGGYAPNAYNHCVADLLRFVDDWFARWCPTADLPPGFLAAHICAGRAWLLLDALDEVAHPRHREAVRNAIHDLADQLQDTRLIVTARVAAYRDTRLDDRFAIVTVKDLDEDQRTRMVHAIYRGLALDDPDRYAADLDARFRSSESLRDLTRTPVMVWTAAVIHALRGRLPEGRAALYDAYVDILLKKSFERARDDAASLEGLVGGQDFSLQDRRHYLTYTAFQVHRLLEAHPERHPGHEEDRVILIGEDELVDDVLAPYFQDKMYLSDLREARQSAQHFVALMVECSGLLYETTQGYTIGDHLTMQEFLAGCYLGDDYRLDDAEGYVAFLGEKVGRSWWREVFLLAAGYLAEKRFKAPKFLEEIARQGESPEERLAALALAGQGLLQLRAHVQRPTWYAGLAQKFANRLYHTLYGEPVAAPVAARHEAGLVLGRLYGYPGEGELVDPRFAGPLGLPAFVPVRQGWFWMGSSKEEVQQWIEETGKERWKDELPRHRVYLDGYEVARTPVTNATFAHFVAAGGYGDERWWGKAIEDGYWKNGQVKDWLDRWYNRPRYWNDGRLDNPAQPVVGVNWYEAVAYCRWLTATLDDGHTYRLPTEAEWERAARGTQNTRYPWGDDWREDHCNSEEAGLGVTSPVGIFPQGAAEGGIQDVAGNVWEWCRDWYGEDYYAHSGNERNPVGPDQGDFRVLRGGSWYNAGASLCRCGFRDWYYPGSRDNDGGFRCVRILSS